MFTPHFSVWQHDMKKEVIFCRRDSAWGHCLAWYGIFVMGTRVAVVL